MPVLSNTIVSILLPNSSILLFLISIPFLALVPKLTIIASGVASPRAQGHDINRTLTKYIIDSFKG